MKENRDLTEQAIEALDEIEEMHRLHREFAAKLRKLWLAGAAIAASGVGIAWLGEKVEFSIIEVFGGILVIIGVLVSLASMILEMITEPPGPLSVG